jgi:hypothetical protein
MQGARKLAGILMILSSVTHTSELFLFDWAPVMAVVLAFGLSFLAIGIGLLRGSDAAVRWGAALPALAALLGSANAIRMGSIHPFTIWHLAVDLTVFPICVWLLLQRRRLQAPPS